MLPQTAIIVGAYPHSLIGFRGDLIRAMVDRGLQVTAMTADEGSAVSDEVARLGAQFESYPVRRNSTNPVADWRTLRALRAAFRKRQPDVILAYTIKPVIWGGIAARAVPQARFFALITGLGYAFQGGSFKRQLLNQVVVRLYRFALRRAEGVIFQNADNRDLFIKHRIVPAAKCHLVNGSGVNVEAFSPARFPAGPPTFLLIARLLGEKGIREYVEAAEIVHRRYPDARFQLVGPPDPSPDGIPIEVVKQWHEAGTIEYLGATEDVRPFLSNCHVYVLPSYHEGMPRTVLEAMAMGRPVLTTNVSGCKETVEPGVNGWLVPHADAERLAERMIWLIENQHQWQPMGDESRRMAEEKFDVRAVNRELMRIFGVRDSG